ncbi:MAG: CapA family protein [Clostridiales bacterium]|nr:CapA family protein [Clostridiales bacterium]
MRAWADKLKSIGKQLAEQLRKTRLRRLLMLPVLAALLAPASAFLWFAFSGQISQAKPPLKLPEEEAGLILRVGGDILLAGAMETYIANKGPDFPFRRVSDLFSAADFSYAGLKAPLADTGSPLPGKPLTLRAAPETVEALALSGLSLMALASGHIMDFDEPALDQTISLLDGAGLGYMGAGEDAEAAAKPYTVSRQGLRVALLDFCESADVFYSYQYPRTLAAGENKAGVAALREEDVLKAIASALLGHDLVVLNLHWGEEYYANISPGHRELAHRFIDGGADVIVGHHSRGLQGVEIYNNGLIVYSLGDLVCGESVSGQSKETTILELELTALGIKSARLYPVLLSAEGRPEPATGRPAADIMARIRALSAGFNAGLTADGDTLKISR